MYHRFKLTGWNKFSPRPHSRSQDALTTLIIDYAIPFLINYSTSNGIVRHILTYGRVCHQKQEFQLSNDDLQPQAVGFVSQDSIE